MNDVKRPAFTANSPVLRWLWDVVYVFVAMTGFRIDRLTLPWLLGGGISLAFSQFVTRTNDIRLTLAYWVFTLLLYYGGNSYILASSYPKRMIEKLGEDKAYRRYEAIVAIMFMNQGLGVSCMTALKLDPPVEFVVGPTAAFIVGGIFFAVGLVTKMWATMLVGVDIYYYRDMFLGRRISEFINAGPYKVLSNPMYGVGQLHAYAFAVLNRSMIGLAAAAVCHTLIYVFYYSIERPFVRRIYLSGPSEAAA